MLACAIRDWHGVDIPDALVLALVPIRVLKPLFPSLNTVKHTSGKGRCS